MGTLFANLHDTRLLQRPLQALEEGVRRELVAERVRYLQVVHPPQRHAVAVLERIGVAPRVVAQLGDAGVFEEGADALHDVAAHALHVEAEHVRGCRGQLDHRDVALPPELHALHVEHQRRARAQRLQRPLNVARVVDERYRCQGRI